MAHVVIQKGHCFRRTGATGAPGEQSWADRVGNQAAGRLQKYGHKATIILADAPTPYPRADAFVAIHYDGSVHTTARGASVGYRNSQGARLAAEWKKAYQAHGFPGGFRRDNYTPGLSGYYGHGRAIAAGTLFAFILEGGFGSNPNDRAWMEANVERAGQSVADAINAIWAPPQPPMVTKVEPAPIVEAEKKGIDMSMSHDVVRIREDGSLWLISYTNLSDARRIPKEDEEHFTNMASSGNNPQFRGVWNWPKSRLDQWLRLINAKG